MERYEREITWWFKELEAQSRVNEYLELFPELKSPLSKFAIGILLWEMKEIITFDNYQDLKLVRYILRSIEENGIIDKLDETFNDMTPLHLVKVFSEINKD